MNLNPDKLELLFVYIDDYIKAVIKNENSPHVEDAVALTEEREVFIKAIRENLFSS